MFYLALRHGFSRWTAFTGMFAYYSMGWVVKANLFNIFKPEPMAFLFIVLSIYCILDKRDAIYAVLLAVGVLFKESVLFVAPLYYTLKTGHWFEPKLLMRSLLLALPAAGVILVIRWQIPMKNDDYFYLSTLPEALQQVQLGRSSYDLGWLLREIGIDRLRSLSPESLLRYTVGSFGGVVALLPLFAVKKNVALFVRLLPFLLLVYAQILIATNDTRLLALGFPAVLLMALNGADSIGRVVRVEVWTLAILFAVLICLMLVRSWMLFLPGVYEAVLFAAYLGICVSWRAYKTRPGDPGPP